MMKKKMIKPLLAIACLLSSISASAYDFEVDGLQYDIMSLSDLTCKIVGLSANNKCSGNYVIPSHVNYLNKTLTVVEVKENLFSGCPEMTGIIIPNTIEEIGDGAFNGCTKLESVKIEDGENWLYVGGYVYGDDDPFVFKPVRGLFYDCPIKSVYFGRHVGCPSSTSNNVYTGGSPFAFIETITELTISDNIKYTPVRDKKQSKNLVI